MNLTDSQTTSLAVLGLAVLVVLGSSFLKTVNLSSKVSHAIAIVLSISTGFVSNYFANNGTTDLTTIAQQSTYIYTASQLIYAYALKGTTFDVWLTKFNLFPAK